MVISQWLRFTEWFMDGKVLVWATEKYGRRNHGSWGSDLNLMGFFVSQTAFDTFNKTKEQLAYDKKPGQEEAGPGERQRRQAEGDECRRRQGEAIGELVQLGSFR